jgi:hypothetical protein
MLCLQGKLRLPCTAMGQGQIQIWHLNDDQLANLPLIPGYASLVAAGQEERQFFLQWEYK